MIAFIFPGQGSQKKGMGQGLFDSVPEYASVEQEINALLGYSLRQMCLEDPDSRLKDTKVTQPCLFVANALHYYSALQQGVRPAYLAGHSLGEYNALLAAGVFDLVTGVRLVKKRGELMSQSREGGMGAVIGLTAAKVEQIVEENGLSSVDIANFNSPSQTVVSGPAEELKLAGALFESAGAQMFIPLQVSAAFHSRYMTAAADAYNDFLTPFAFSSPQLPVIANVTAEPYPHADASQSIKSLLVKQITHSVRWTASVRALERLGATEFKEMGPGNVLTRLVQQIRNDRLG